jgi:hypothetical protein
MSMGFTALVLALSLLATRAPAVISAAAAPQAPACQQALATLTVTRGSYAVIPATPFERRVFLYAGDFKASGSGFTPFQVWVVEGVYGPPFPQATGTLAPPSFDKIRTNGNVRATPVNVSRGNTSDFARFRFGGVQYLVHVVAVKTRELAVDVRICR